jgi:hypothetical protein
MALAGVSGLGAYHGINPAMGWLFAVALGLQERRRGAVLRALPAVALGHEASIAAVAGIWHWRSSSRRRSCSGRSAPSGWSCLASSS